MPITYKQKQDFNDSVISSGLLEESIEWIKNNLSPDDVFSDSDLATWAEKNDYKKEE